MFEDILQIFHQQWYPMPSAALCYGYANKSYATIDLIHINILLLYSVKYLWEAVMALSHQHFHHIMYCIV